MTLTKKKKTYAEAVAAADESAQVLWAADDAAANARLLAKDAADAVRAAMAVRDAAEKAVGVAMAAKDAAENAARQKSQKLSGALTARTKAMKKAVALRAAY